MFSFLKNKCSKKLIRKNKKTISLSENDFFMIEAHICAIEYKKKPVRRTGFF